MLWLLWLLANAAAAQVPPAPSPLTPVVVPTDTLTRVEACPASSPEKRAALRVGAILFVGNERTRARTLLAELDFRVGDSLSVAGLAARLEANRRRLFNLQLFHAVLAQGSCGSTGQLTVLFSVQERWYLLPVPILSLAAPTFNNWLTRPDRWQRFDYGLHLTHDNVRGRAEELLLNVQLGFNRKYEAFYEIPGLGRARRVGLGFGASIYQSRNLDYAIAQDRPLALAEAETEGFAVRRYYVSGGVRLRRTVRLRSALDFSYHREFISPRVAQLNPDYLLGGASGRQFGQVSWLTTLNQRNTFAYPLTGQFWEAALTYRHFWGARAVPAPNPALATVRLRYAHYRGLGHNFYYALGLWGQARLLSPRLAYPDARALGYDALVRGYDAYVVEGRHFGLVQQGLSWRAWAPPPLRLPFGNNPKVSTLPLAVYLNAFADVGAAGGALGRPEPAGSTLPGTVLASAGLGLHLVTYYDWVLCLELTRTLTAYPRTGLFVRTSFPI